MVDSSRVKSNVQGRKHGISGWGKDPLSVGFTFAHREFGGYGSGFRGLEVLSLGFTMSVLACRICRLRLRSDMG